MAGTVITKKGLQLIAKLVASGTALTFTRVSVGTGSVPAGYDPGNMTDLNNYKMDGSISSCSFLGDEASIIMQISSLGVETGFTITETGLFATDPDEGEILYSYLDLSKDPQYVYEENSAISKFVEMTLVVKVGTVERVTAQLNPHSLLTRDGDISDTSIEELEPIDTKYPVPSAGESAKVFMGKVKKYIEDTKPLDADMTVYVATTGSDTTGDGTSSNPYETITYALSTIPKNLGDHTATINVADGTYAEDVKASGFYSGFLTICSSAENSFNANCVVQSLAVWTCFANVKLQGLTVAEETNKNAIHIVNSHTVDVSYIRSLKENPTTSCVVCVKSYVSIAYCELSNHLRAVYATEGSTVFLDNSTVGDILNLAGSIVTSRNSSFIGSAVVNPGGVLVSPYGAKIGTLSTDVTLYVATTGSDLTGDGTSAKPFKTIQYAINALPKDLGGYDATIIVADGNYSESLFVAGFKTGTLYIKSEHPGIVSSATKVISIDCRHNTSYIAFDGFEVTTTLTNSIVCNSCANVIFNSIRSVGVTSTFSGIQATEVNLFRVYNCELSNKKNAVFVINTKGYVQFTTGIGNTVGIQCQSASVIHLGGSRPSGALNQLYGGVILNENGTQISGLITSGLSCTWGTISGGYVRHGNLNGVAMVTIQMGVKTTITLNPGSYYKISGFPLPVGGNTAVTATAQTWVENCWLDASNGTINYLPRSELSSSLYTILFNVTYLTNS